MRLETPDKIRTPKRKLYCTAETKPEFRLYLLYDKVCRADILTRRLKAAETKAA
jgi:RNA-directed DNA polymerase